MQKGLLSKNIDKPKIEAKNEYKKGLFFNYFCDEGVTDEHKIVIVFFSQTDQSYYEYKMPVPGSSNKSEYEIISAMIYFSGKQLSYEVF